MSLLAGAPAPLFHARSPVNPRFAFGSLGGRYILLLFVPEPGPERDEALGQINARSALLKDEHLVVMKPIT